MLRLLQRTSYRDACQPSLPGRPSPGAAERPSSSSARGAVRAGRRHETRRLSALRCRRRRDSPFSSRAKGGRVIVMWNGMSDRVTSIALPGVGPRPATERNSFGRRAGSQQVGGREWLIFGARPTEPDHPRVRWQGREPSSYPKESRSIFKGTIPFSRAGVSSIRVYEYSSSTAVRIFF